MSKLGSDLISTYILKKPLDVKSKFPVKGTNIVVKFSYDIDKSRVYINEDQYFDKVSEDVWNFLIGVHQVLHK